MTEPNVVVSVDDRGVHINTLVGSPSPLTIGARGSGANITLDEADECYLLTPQQIADLMSWKPTVLDAYFTSQEGRSRPLLPDIDATMDVGVYQLGQQTLVVVPYLTYKRKALALRVEVFETSVYEQIQTGPPQFKKGLFARRRETWLLGELPERADDNGFAFFRWLRQNKRREVDAYYVLERDSPRWEEVNRLGNVVAHRTTRHLQIAESADVMACSHDFEYALPTRDPEQLAKYEAFRVLMGHGVYAIKNVTAKYGYETFHLKPDLLVMNSEREKRVAIEHLGFPDAVVVNTGMPRLDSLFAPTTGTRDEILLFPTWRDWIVRGADIHASDFLQGWLSLAGAEELGSLATKHGLLPIMYLHPNLSPYRSAFEEAGVEVVREGDVKAQDLLRETRYLITDYSSVGFDFAALGKPVVFYQFDAKRFFKHPPYLEVPSELPGPAEPDVEGTLRALSGFIEDPADFESHAEKARVWVEHRDDQSSQRLYDAIRARRSELQANPEPVLSEA